MNTEKKYGIKAIFYLIITLVILSLNVSAVSGNSAPVISNQFPAQGSIDIELNPVLTADIIDADGDSISWTVYIYDGETSWKQISGGSAADGVAHISVPTNIVTQYSYDYSWKIIVSDAAGSGQTIEESYSFKTISNANYAPFVRNPYPADRSTDIPLTPVLKATVLDVNGDSFTWTVELKVGNDWTVVDSAEAQGGRADISEQASAAAGYDTAYAWRLTADDHVKKPTVVIYNFRTRPSNYMPAITNIVPADQAADVPLSPTLSAEISDFENDPFSWKIELLNGNQWETVGEAEGVTGSVTASAVASAVTEYVTPYSWRITATDLTGSGKSNVVELAFTSKQENYIPTISNATPIDGQLAVSIFNDVSDASAFSGTQLTAFIEDKDNTPITVAFSWLNPETDAWEVLDTQVATTKTFTTRNGWTKFITPLTTYSWKVTAVDSTGSSAEGIYSFKTGGLLRQKFRANIGNVNGDQIMPVMGDVDNDGTQEIVMASGQNIVIVDGKTGAIEQTIPGASNSAVELVDINNDGTPEILHSMPGPKLRALRGDGSVIWTTPRLKGEGFSMFPIMAYDIDGDGYPTIYFATEDQTPRIWDGNFDNYNGALTMIDHNGNVLKDTWLYHPCWGGMSLGDVNNDGKFEIYVSDRKANGYMDGNSSLGPHAYDAETLELLWSRKDVQHSSPIPIIADVIPGNDKMEVVLTPITMAGPMVVDALTGRTISGMDYSGRKLPTHGVATVHNMDDDANMEIIMGTSYPASAPAEFVVFDLITGEVEFRPELVSQTAWAPKVGDVDGDGKMEILAATGPQGWTGTYPLLIYRYDSGLDDYTLVDSVSPKNAGQLMPARVYDTDSDGFNEVVVAGYGGILVVYDTGAATPNPAPRTWLQMYSEYRQGAAEYVRPPGVPQPLIKELNIADGAINVLPNAMLSAKVVDFHYDKLDVEMKLAKSPSGPWTTIASYKDGGNGWYNYTAAEVNELNTTYYWNVKVSDPKADNLVAEETVSFTTSACDEGMIMITYYNDSDSDHYGSGSEPLQMCALASSNPPAGYSLNNTDCNDINATINPGAAEICDGIDNNCDLGIDDLDSDIDLILDCHPDNCPFVSNPDQNDTNNNSVGDVCECGNGIFNIGEECDGPDFGGKTCQTLGFDRGNLACTSSCSIDSSGCSNRPSGSGGGGSSRRNGGGGGSSTSSTSTDTSSTWDCGSWSECIDGKQTQICTHKILSGQKTNSRECVEIPKVIDPDMVNNLSDLENNLTGAGIGSEDDNKYASTGRISKITGAVIGSMNNIKPGWGIALVVLGIVSALVYIGVKNLGPGKNQDY